MTVHQENFPCEQCPKLLKNENDLRKHVKAHKDNKFCHMFNNFSKCKFGTSCIFLHEKAKFCLYDGYCTRPSCQYQHKFGCLEKNKFSTNNFMKRKQDNTKDRANFNILNKEKTEDKKVEEIKEHRR